MNTIEIMIIGSGGHACVIADMILQLKHKIIGFLDDNKTVGTSIWEFPILGKIAECQQQTAKAFVIGIGDNIIRKDISDIYNLPYAVIIHPTAVVGTDVKIAVGTVVMAGAIINSRTTIGQHSIINTGAIVEHDSHIGDYVHISPGVTMGGSVTIGECTHVGIGATIKNGITICNHVIIGAGAVVVKDIVCSGTYIGVPARLV